MESTSNTSVEIFNPEHFGVIGSLFMDKRTESVLVRGLEQVIVQKQGMYEEAGQKAENEYQLNEILFDIERFAVLASKDEVLSTFILPEGVVCQVMHKSHNNPQPVILFEFPILDANILDIEHTEYVGEDAARFLSMALDTGLSMIVCGERERWNILGGLTRGIKATDTLVDIGCGSQLSSSVERTISLNYITSSGWAKMIGPDQIIPLALTYRPQCIRIGEIGDINLSAIFMQYSDQVLAGLESSSSENALNALQNLLPNWFQQLSFDESLERFARRLPLLIHASRSREGIPAIQSINEIRVSKSTLNSKSIYLRDETNPKPVLIRTGSDSNIGKFLAGKISADDWARSWAVNDIPQKQSGFMRLLNRLRNNIK